MNKTKKSAAAALCLAAVLAIGGAFAFLSDTDSAVNRFSFLNEDGESTVDIRLTETDWDDTDDNENGVPDAAENILPGQELPKNPVVHNDGESDMYAYITVLVPTKSVVTASANGTWQTQQKKELYSLEGLSEDWTEISVTENGTNPTYTAHVFAYNDTLEAGGDSDELFTSVKLINLVNDQIDADDNLNIYVNAYGIQTAGIEGTQSEIWSVVMNDYAGNSGETFSVFSPISADSGHMTAAI